MMAGDYVLAIGTYGSNASPMFLYQAGSSANLNSHMPVAPAVSAYGRAVVWAPDGSWLALARSGSSSTYLSVYNTATFTMSNVAGVTAGVNDMALSPDGATLAAISGSTLLLVDTTTWLVSTLSLPASTSTNSRVLYSPDGGTIVVSLSASPYLCRFDTSTLVRTNITNPATIIPTPATMAFHPDGSVFIVGWAGSTVRGCVYDTSSWSYEMLPVGMGNISAVAFNADGSRLAVCRAASAAPFVRLYDTTTDPWDTVRDLGAATCNALRFSPDDRYLAVGFGAMDVLYDATAEYSVVYSRSNSDTSKIIAFSPDSRFVLFAPSGATSAAEYQIDTGLTHTLTSLTKLSAAYSPVPIGGEISNTDTDPVRDASGLPVVRQVWLTNRDTAVRISSVNTNAAGRYSFFCLAAGVPRMVIFRAANDMENSAVIDWVYPE